MRQKEKQRRIAKRTGEQKDFDKFQALRKKAKTLIDSGEIPKMHIWSWVLTEGKPQTLLDIRQSKNQEFIYSRIS